MRRSDNEISMLNPSLGVLGFSDLDSIFAVACLMISTHLRNIYIEFCMFIVK